MTSSSVVGMPFEVMLAALALELLLLAVLGACALPFFLLPRNEEDLVTHKEKQIKVP